jgi:uncharacterized protein
VSIDTQNAELASRTDSWAFGGNRIVYQHCPACEHRWYFLRTFCPRCGNAQPATLAASGQGRVVAATVVHRAPSDTFRAIAPYTLVLVDADEGFRLMAHAAPGVAIGDRVHADARTIAGRVLPYFEMSRTE